MSKCKHEWRIYHDGTNCIKCKCNVLQAYQELEVENKQLIEKVERLEFQSKIGEEILRIRKISPCDFEFNGSTCLSQVGNCEMRKIFHMCDEREETENERT